MDKFGRSYKLVADGAGGTTVEISPPFSLEFDIIRNVLSSANTSTIKVYNLNEETRKKLYKDQFSPNILRKVELKAGYGTSLPTVFKGNVQHGWSVRPYTEFVTTLESFDGGFAFVNGKTSKGYPKGTTNNSVIDDIVASLPGVERGAVGEFPGKLLRGNTLTGSSTSLLGELTGDHFFIDNGRAYCLGDAECIRGSIQVISSESGLLGTPVRSETFINFDMIFEPRLLIGQLVELRSSTAEAGFNGLYKVISLHHRGMISPTVNGAAVTSVGLFLGPKQLTLVN